MHALNASDHVGTCYDTATRSADAQTMQKLSLKFEVASNFELKSVVMLELLLELVLRADSVFASRRASQI